ncbi:MAG: antitoxin [Acidobacteriota bacterium]|nr:antitoxin [Acidobacteriota bacterium]
MGFGDKLKGLRDQAQQAVAGNKDKIQGAVQNVGEAANTRTHGKYADKIAKVGDKVSGGVEKFAQGGDAAPEGGAPEGGAPEGGAPEGGGSEAGTAADGADQSDASAAPTVEPDEQDAPAAADDAAASAPPEFE